MLYQVGFFEVEEVYARIDINNPLKKIQDYVNWGGLEKIMEQVVFSSITMAEKAVENLCAG